MGAVEEAPDPVEADLKRSADSQLPRWSQRARLDLKIFGQVPRP
jgi:hypothetical protein